MTLLYPSQIGRQQDPVEKNSSRVSVSGTYEAQEDALTANWVICKTVLQVCFFRLLNFFLGIFQQPELMRIIIVKYLKQIEVRYQTTPPIVFHWRAEGGDFLLWFFFHRKTGNITLKCFSNVYQIEYFFLFCYGIKNWTAGWINAYRFNCLNYILSLY